MESFKEFLKKKSLLESADSDTVRSVINQSKQKSYGVTNFRISKDKLIVQHGGNMGATIEDVKQNTKKYFGFDVFNKLRILSTKGSPDFLYTVKFRLEPFKKA